MWPQVLHVGNDSCAMRLIVGGEALDEFRERARRLDALPDVAANVIETKVTAPSTLIMTISPSISAVRTEGLPR